MPIGGTAAFGTNQHPRITTLYLNSLHRHGDPAPGVNVSTAQVSGSIVQPYGGFEGGKLTITNPFAPQFSDPAVGPLYGGVYQYVQFDPAIATPVERGQVLYWMDELHYIVTNDGTTAPAKKIAGVALNETLAGYWDFIQISGIASVLFTSAATLGDLVAATPGNPATVATGGTVDATFLGTAVLTDPVANEVSPVELNLLGGFNY